MFKGYFLKFCLSVTLLLLFSCYVYAEFIFLKDGSILECTIIKDSAGSLTIRHDKKTEQINRNRIMRILYTKLYLGKVFIHKTTGEGIEAYKVDEDQDSYTFRENLYEPKEFKLNRSEVLFMARKNPTGLRGIPDTDKIYLSWLAPYTPVKIYRLYKKSKKTEKYEQYVQTGSRNYTVKDLKSNTDYYFIVTAIGTDDHESLPSNEVEVRTLNIRPYPPRGVVYKKLSVNEKEKKLSAGIEWEEATDPDGKVINYHIYKKSDNGFEKIAETKKTDYTVNGLDTEITHYFAVRSTDNLGDESDDSYIVNSRNYIINARVCGTYIMPFGDFGNMFKPGYGALLSLSIDNLFLDNLGLGFESGYWYLPGKDELREKTYIIPVFLTAGYRFSFSHSFHIAPKISFGYSYNKLTYWKYLPFSTEKSSFTDSAFLPAAMAGISAFYRVSNMFTVQIGANAGAIFDSEKTLAFASFDAGFGLHF